MLKAGYPGIRDVSILFETADPDSENLKITALVQYTQSLLSQALREHDFNDLANPLDRASTVHDIYNQAAYIGFGPDAAAYYAHHRHIFKAAQLLSHAATFASALIEISQQADPTEPCPHRTLPPPNLAPTEPCPHRTLPPPNLAPTEPCPHRTPPPNLAPTANSNLAPTVQSSSPPLRPQGRRQIPYPRRHHLPGQSRPIPRRRQP